MGKQIRYYVHGHTGKGFIDLLPSNLEQINQIVLIENKNKKVVTALLETILTLLNEEDIEIIQSTLSKDLIDGIIIRNKSLAIIHESLYQANDNGKNIQRVTIPVDEDEDYFSLKDHQKIYDEAYNYFKKGLSIHDQLEKVYISKMDFNKANKVIEQLLQQLFKDVEKKKEKAILYERLFGTNTPDGIVNTVLNLIEPIEKKIFILGRAGTGKSYVMNQVLNKCIELGIDVELYRCSLDPNSIDMLIIRELNVCLHDNTAPHTIAVNDPSIQIIDMYKETVDQQVEKEYGERIKILQKKYKEQMQLGLKVLKSLNSN